MSREPAPPGICMVKFGNEATVQSGLLRFILTVQIDLDKQGNKVCSVLRSLWWLGSFGYLGKK